MSGSSLAGHRQGAQPVARRGAWRRDLLSRLPPRSRPAAMSSRSAAPKPARRWAAMACATTPEQTLGRRVRRDHRRWRGHPRGGLLSRQLRAVAGHHGRRQLHGRVDPERFDDDHDRSSPRSARGMITVFVPRDSAALSMGADEVAQAIAARSRSSAASTSTIVRNGSRGMLWLEPLVEVETTQRAASPMARCSQATSRRSSTADFPIGGDTSARRTGQTEEIPYLKRQERLTFARCGIIDPLSVADYRAHGGFAGLQEALAIAAARDRHGGRPTPACAAAAAPASRPASSGRRCSTPEADQKYICCNADEGDSGTFADRMLMEGDPFILIEGMTIAGIAIGATKGYIYIRSEYPHAIATMTAGDRHAPSRRLARRQHSGLGQDLPSRTCARAPAPISAARKPRCSKASRASAAWCAQAADPGARRPVRQADRHQQRSRPSPRCRSSSPRAAAYYTDFGMGRSRGTLPSSSPATSSRAAWSRRPSASRLRELDRGFRRRHRFGRPVRAVQVGGPLGAYLPASQARSADGLRGLRRQ